MTIAISVDGSHHGEVVSTPPNDSLLITSVISREHIIEAVMTIESDGEIITSNKLEYTLFLLRRKYNYYSLSIYYGKATQFDTQLFLLLYIILCQSIQMLI